MPLTSTYASGLSRFSLYEDYVKQYGIGRSNPAKDFYWDWKDRPWWPMRHFMGDWMLAVWVYRIKPRKACEVGLFRAEVACFLRAAKESAMAVVEVLSMQPGIPSNPSSSNPTQRDVQTPIPIARIRGRAKRA